MKKIFYPVTALAVIAVLVIPVLADTIRLKDGSVIRGEVVGFRDQQFVVLIGGGSKGRRSQTTIYVEDVESIEFDSSGATSTAPSTNDVSSGDNTRTETASQPPRSEPSPSTSRRTTQPVSGSSPTFFTIKVSVRADNSNNGWTNSGLVVRKGQRLRINSSGRVSLGNGRYATPAGVSTIPDNDKLMRTEPTGALIAVIGDDNDDFILVGTRRDFVAQRDGVLFLGVNEGNLTDNTGTYDVVVEAEASGSNTR
jgi:hypothetical protein